MQRRTMLGYCLLLVVLFGLTLPTDFHLNYMHATAYVDPLIGTGNSNAINALKEGVSGNVFPGAAAPFGMLQWSPDTVGATTGGYQSDGSPISGFSLTHFDGAGCPNNGDIPILPTIGSASEATGIGYGRQVAHPGYYGVHLNNGVKTELTATQRSGSGRFTFPATSQANIIIDASRAAAEVRNAQVHINGTREISGQETSGNFCGHGNSYTIYFTALFNRDFHVSQNGNGRVVTTFDTSSDPVVQMKVGISYVSVANARGNLQAENPGWSFDQVVESTSEQWNQRLNQIQVSGSTRANLTKFYTAYYHTLLHPNVFSDSNGQYIGLDQRVHTAAGYTQYTSYSGWDMYRSDIQLLALFAPKETNDMVKSLLADAQQCGAFPRWVQNNSDTGTMVGDPGTITIASAYAFGINNFDANAALTTMIKSGNQVGTHCDSVEIRSGLAEYINGGYIPIQDTHLWGSASSTLEFSSADFSIAQFAASRGNINVAQTFLSRADNWQHIFNQNTGYIEPRNQDGSWQGNFNPNATDGFVEGNAAQYSWMVPYAIPALFAKMGGDQKVVSRLNQFFIRLNAGLNDPNFYIGNEPNFATPWMYDWTSEPWRTQDTVRRILDETFSSDPGGLPGNDDLGATSSWYVWGALGIYPEIPGVAGFALSSPTFASETLHLGNGKTLTLQASGTPARYVQQMKLNDQAYQNTWLSWDAIKDGGALQFTLGDKPSSWGTQTFRGQ